MQSGLSNVCSAVRLELENELTHGTLLACLLGLSILFANCVADCACCLLECCALADVSECPDLLSAGCWRVAKKQQPSKWHFRGFLQAQHLKP